MPSTTRSSAKPARAALLSAALVVAACFSGPAAAQRLGNYGNVWEIQEQDAIDMLKGKLTQMEKKGELKKLWTDYRDRYLNTIENPEPLPGITKASAAAVRIFDPSFTFAEDIQDHLGNVVVRAGTKVNPLEKMPLTKALIFIDGRDPAQVAFAKTRSDANPRDKVILVAGSFLKLNREWKRPIYFDQRGHLSTRMGIKRVPAVVSQKGAVLQIEELVLPASSVVKK